MALNTTEMKSKALTKSQFLAAQKAMNKLLAIATERGGFEHLSRTENADLNKHSLVVKQYEDQLYKKDLSQTLQGIIQLHLHEKNLSQKDLAAILKTTDSRLSAIMHNKRKPNIPFLKAIHDSLGIDGNLLLRVA